MTDTIVTLNGALRLPQAVELASRLQDALRQGALKVDAREVTVMDAAIVQVLLAACAEASRLGHAPELALPAEGQVRDLFGRLGLDDVLQGDALSFTQAGKAPA